MGDDLIWPASLAALAGVGVLRFAWSRAQRSKLANAGGWGLLALATVLAAAEAGAWGVSVAWLFAMLAVGWAEADANAAALLAVPIVWGVLATIVLMQHTRRAQFLTLALATLPLFPALLAGS